MSGPGVQRKLSHWHCVLVSRVGKLGVPGGLRLWLRLLLSTLECGTVGCVLFKGLTLMGLGTLGGDCCHLGSRRTLQSQAPVPLQVPGHCWECQPLPAALCPRLSSHKAHTPTTPHAAFFSEAQGRAGCRGCSPPELRLGGNLTHLAARSRHREHPRTQLLPQGWCGSRPGQCPGL